jgi:cobalt/nickel transport system ATP-binding protein
VTSNLLSIDAAAIRYGRAEPALEDVRLDVSRGESVAILGGNGTGKTALLSFIAGVLPRAGAKRQIAGVTIDSPRDAVRAGAGLLVQDPDDQLLAATVRDDVAFGPSNLGLSSEDIARRVTTALKTVGITSLADREVESLSFGERKRACLAGILAMSPALLLLDEPTAGLDPAGERALCATLRELSSRGDATLLVATHAVDLVPQFATRVIVLGEGRILADGPCREILGDDALLARTSVRRPWPLELWATARSAFSPNTRMPLTLEEVVSCLRPLSS